MVITSMASMIWSADGPPRRSNASRMPTSRRRSSRWAASCASTRARWLSTAARCRPTPAHPEPVVLVHGTFGDSTNWAVDAPQLRAAGYCTFAIDYGLRGTGEIARSAQQLKAVVDQVLAATGASKVDIIGH